MIMERFLQHHRRHVLGGILLAYLLFGILFATGTRSWRGPDENQHYRYAELLAGKEKLPLLWVTTEAHQPPMYYWILQPFFWITPHWTAEDRLLLLRFVSVTMGAVSVLLVHAGARRFAGDASLVPWVATLLVAFNPQYLFLNATVNSDVLANLLGAALFLLLINACTRSCVAQRPWRALFLRRLHLQEQ